MPTAILRKEVITGKIACRISAVAAFVILTSLGAFVRIPLPFTPVPFTLQTFFVLLSGALLGAGLGSLSQSLYLLLGIGGISLFSGASAGTLYLCGPTGGYLVGFILASLFIGRTMPRVKENMFFAFGALMAGDIILLCCGTLWLKILLGLPLARAFLLGFLPFLPGDIVKAILAAALYLKFRSRLKQVLF
ncbi:MAG: biotin transporter BioY [Candidatus Omnitrophota bacterium]|jgi:biotin transport system substrate-specific component